MKMLSILFMIVASISLVIGVIWRLMPANFPLAGIPPRSILHFTAVCLLFVIALCVYQIANKKQP
jgi:uncharacterized protein YacL